MAKKKPTRPPIEAKPTDLFGFHFRSRLEARWAAFLEYATLVDTWKYEPLTFRHPDLGWDYTPDFLITVSSIVDGFLEIKPVLPTEEYLNDLKKFLPLLEKPLYICFGSFYNELPNIVQLDKEAKIRPVRNPQHLGFLQPLLFSDSSAIERARRLRFDLATSPEREGSLKSLRANITRSRRNQQRQDKKSK